MPLDTDNAVVDRGDDFTPNGVDAPEVKADPSAEDKAAADALAAQIEAEKAEKDAKKDDAKKDDTKKDDDKAKAKDTRLPLARHEEILNKERERRAAVEAELAQYKQGKQVAELGAQITEAETKLQDLEATYAKQLTDGETEKAAATMAEIRRTERSINERASEAREAAAEARAVERVRYDMTVERLEDQFPALNPDHDDFDKTKTAEILELKEAYQLKGYPPSAALQKAVKLIMPPATKAQESAVEVEPRVDAKAVEAARKAAAAAATAAAVGKTPASMNKTGLDSDRAGGGLTAAKDVIKMPYNEFVKLDDAALARLRGDEI